MLEKTIEAYFVKRIKEIGGVAEKFTSPNKRAVPDRLVLLPSGVALFVELKAPGTKPTPLQLSDHNKRRALGFRVEVIDSKEGVDKFMETLNV